MSDQDQIQYIPFHAINQFMLDDYRLHVVQTVLSRQEQLPPARRNIINALIKKLVSVPGFRNSAHAPLPIKVKGALTAFNRNPDFVAQILQGWCELNPELRERVYAMLVAREWKLLPGTVDRSVLPGFMIEWKKGETYDALDAAYAEMYPENNDSDYDIRLMVVWLANRLPYNMGDDEADETAEAEDGEKTEG